MPMTCPLRARISAFLLGAMVAMVAAALLLPSAASAASAVKPPVTWKVLDVSTAGEGCAKTVLMTWPRVPGEWMWWMINGGVRSPIKAPFDDVRTAGGKVYDRAPKGMHQKVVRAFQYADCAALTRLVNSLTATRPPAIEVYSNADHFIQGTVKLDCAKEPQCPRANGVEGVKVTAGKAKTTTLPGGQYLMKVSKGVHTVRADGGALQVITKPRRVDVRRRTTGTADFKACGIRGLAAPRGSRATPRAVGGGTWKGGDWSCLNEFKISWRGSANALSISWASAPRCATGIGKPKLMVKGGVVDPAKPGHNLIAGADAVSFMYPLDAPEEPNNVHGELLADGTGTVTANAHIGQCTYGISNLKLKRE